MQIEQALIDLSELPFAFITATPDDYVDCDYTMAELKKPAQPHRGQTERC